MNALQKKLWPPQPYETGAARDVPQAIKVLGYAVPSCVASKVFAELDADRSGALEYKELGSILNKRVGASLTRQDILRYTPGGQQVPDAHELAPRHCACVCPASACLWLLRQDAITLHCACRCSLSCRPIAKIEWERP